MTLQYPCSAALQRCYAFIKEAELLSPDQIADYYDPASFTDYENLVNFHELEYKISRGSQALNPKHERYQQALINEWKKALREIVFYFHHVILKTFEFWVEMHDDDDPQKWAENRINNWWRDPEMGIETYDEYIDYMGDDEAEYNIEQALTSTDQYGVNPSNFIGKYAEEIPELKDFFMQYEKESLMHETDETLVEMNEYLFDDYCRQKYGKEYEDYFEAKREEYENSSSPPYDWEIIYEFMGSKGDDAFIEDLILENTDIQETVDRVAEMEKLSALLPYELIEKFLKKLYEDEILWRYQREWGARLDASKSRVGQMYKKWANTNPHTDSLPDLIVSMTLALNTAHTTGSMLDHFPAMKLKEYRGDPSMYNYTWEEFADYNDLDMDDYDQEQEWKNEQLRRLTPHDLNNISNLDSSGWDRELLQDGFLIPLGGGVREFHEHSKMSASLFNLLQHI